MLKVCTYFSVTSLSFNYFSQARDGFTESLSYLPIVNFLFTINRKIHHEFSPNSLGLTTTYTHYFPQISLVTELKLASEPPQHLDNPLALTGVLPIPLSPGSSRYGCEGG